jgi:sugar lactone lactonase YvrE
LLGEGAIWDDKRQVLYWLDIDKAALFATDPRTRKTERRDLGGKVGDKIGTVVPRTSGGLVLAFEHCLACYDWDTERLETLAPFEKGMQENRANDGKCDPRGRLWVGSLCPMDKPGGATLYRVDADSSVHPMVPNVTISNGIVWSADRRRMYYIDTPDRRIDVFDYDDASGVVTNRRECVPVPESMGYPDGMAIDDAGNLWVALFGGGRVACWNPQTTDLIAEVRLPVSNVTSCAFGGADRDELFITTARNGLDDAELAAQPQAGSLFWARPGARGTATFAFAG